jgi:phosphoglycolate phosphatase (TIGR01487 family)
MKWLPDGWVPRLVAVDIDGTLTDEQKRLDLSAVAALRDLEAAGIPVVLCTGNTRAIAYGLWRFIGLSGPMVCENGGVVWFSDDDVVLRADAGEAREACEWLSSRIDGLDPAGITTNAWRESEWCLKTEEDVDAITTALKTSPWPHLQVVRTGFAIHVMDPCLSKGAGLEVVLERLGLQAEDLLVAGDAPNDLSMFALARWSVAVGGAFPQVQAAASVVSPHLHGSTFSPLVAEILAQ